MAQKEIGKLTLTLDPEALRNIISGGRLLEFAETAGKQAASQIAAQVVQHVGELAASGHGIKSTGSLGFAFVTVDGDPGFGTVPHFPPRPRAGGVLQEAE